MRRPSRPRPRSSALFRRSVAAFDELKQSGRDIEFLADLNAGELKIGTPDSLAATLLPLVIKRFRQDHPRIVVRVSTIPAPTYRSLGLRNREFDLVLGLQANPLPTELEDDLRSECLFEDRLIFAAGMHTRWARRRKIDLAELGREPWILNEPPAWSYARVQEAFGASGLAMPKANLLTPAWPLIMHFVANGPFITAYARSIAKLSGLKELPVKIAIWPWPIVMLTLKGRTLSPAVDRFMQCAREVAKSILRH